MSKHDHGRREFLVRAALGAGTVVTAGLAPEAPAQNRQEHTDPHTAAVPHGQGAFFNREDAATVAAFTERLMPGAPGKPGALDAGVLNYIDLALAGAYADLQEFYRRGLAQLDAYCRTTHKAPFAQLGSSEQDQVIAALEQGTVAGFTWPTAQAFFNTLRTHTMEGMFADPVYGGNKDFAGWRLIGFPGAQAIFTPADMQSNGPFTRGGIVGLQAQTTASKREE